MFEALITLMLSALFIQAQAADQTVLDALMEPPAQPLEVSAVNEPTAPRRNVRSDSLGVEVGAQSVLVVDDHSGQVLYQKDPMAVRPIASITKLMTALVFLDKNPGWNQEITIQSSDYRIGGINYLIAGEKVAVEDIFYTMIIASSNEGAVALARSTGLSSEEFVSAMNQKAEQLGMANTHFSDATGLSEENVSTAVDLAILLKQAISHPALKSAMSQKEYRINIINKNITRRLTSTDRILGQEFGINENIFTVVAGKTGFLEKAGYCFASEVKNQNNDRILTVVLGSNTIDQRFQDTKSLAYWVFNNYIWQN